MSAAVIAYTLVLASLNLVSAARADEPLAGIAAPVAVLHLVNGDRLPGTVLDSDLEGRLQWQGTAFTKPFRFDGESISKIRFAAPSFAAAEAGEFRFDLSGGDVLFGDLVSVGTDELIVDASQAGRLRLKRSESLRLSRCRGNPALIYQGPNGLDGWGPPESAAAWNDDAGHLTTDRDSAVLECDVKLPPQALIELAISWKTQPDFALVLGSDGSDDGAKQAFRFELLDGELIVRRETQHDFDIESVMPLEIDGPGRIHLLALLDQERERLQVLSTDGKPLATIHAAADTPRVWPGIRLEHQHGGLRLELLRVSRYAGRPPHEVTEDAPRVHLINGSVVYGNIKRYDAGRRCFVLQTKSVDETIEVDEVENVFLAKPRTKSEESEQARQFPTAQPADHKIPKKPAPFLFDDFAAPDPKLWKVGIGQWEHAGGRLLQKQLGHVICRLISLADHPRDFVATFRFKTTGGGTRSVGMAFDVTETDDWHSVYVGAHDEGGTKLQVMHHRPGKDVYPIEGRKRLDMQLNKEYVLQVEVRGRLVKAWVDGRFILAYRLPYQRQTGKLFLSAFDAAVEFISIEVTPLAPPSPPLLTSSARVVCADGTRLSGRIAGFRDEHLELKCFTAIDLVALPVAALREVRFAYDEERIGNPFEAPRPLLQSEGLQLHGRLATARAQGDASCLAWQPLGSSTSSPLRAGTSGRIALATPFLVDNFARPNPKLWQMGQGQWEYSGGRLLQRHTGNMLCSLQTVADHPRDFSAALRFKITGGKANKNVALQFDVTENDSAHFVYLTPALSALQIGHRQQGKETGAGEGGGIKIDVNLNQEYLLEIEVRDRFFNVSLDGQPMLAYHLPYERRAGKLRLSSYEASAEFISIAVRPLPFTSDVADVAPPEGATARNPPQLDGGKAPQGAIDPRKPSVPPDRIERRVQPVGEELPDRLFLRTGDTLPCRVTSIDERGVSLTSAYSETSVALHDRVQAVELGKQTNQAALDAGKLTRLLTLPRAQKLDPPTHLIGATNGDYLRGKLLAMDERVLRFEVQGGERELIRSRIARVVWLGLDEDDAAGEAPRGCVQAVQLDGARVTFIAEQVDDDWISGEADLLGTCRVRIDQLRELLFGDRVRLAAANSVYSWKLVDAQTPLAFRADHAQSGDAVEGTDSSLVGMPAFDFELPMLDGAKFRLSQRRGTTIVLDFWASWCGPCMQRLPKVAGVVAACDRERVQLVAVNLQETSAEATDALRRLKLEIPVALDSDGKVAKEYGATSIPYTVVVGPDGTVARVFVGTGPQLDRQLEAALSELRKADPR